MKSTNIIVTAFFLLLNHILSGQDVIDKSCQTNVDLVVVIDTVYDKMDSYTKDTTSRGPVDYKCFCNPCYVLRPLNQKYKVISFIMIFDSPHEVVERRYTGDTIGCNTGIVQVGSAPNKSTLSINCIKARHENGNIYTLKNIFIQL